MNQTPSGHLPMHVQIWALNSAGQCALPAVLCDALRRAGCVADRFPHALRVRQVPDVAVDLSQCLQTATRLCCQDHCSGLQKTCRYLLACANDQMLDC